VEDVLPVISHLPERVQMASPDGQFQTASGPVSRR
jgi:hypothetical protein